MKEVGVLIGKDGKPIYWHFPPGSQEAYLPDSHDLWEIIWKNRDNIHGFAHSHPGGGPPNPSGTDTSTFEAIEAALGRSLVWWIVTEDGIRLWCKKMGPSYEHEEVAEDKHPWLPILRSHSYDTAREGYVWVCAACGKRAKNKYNGGLDQGWDESCFMHSVLCPVKSLEISSFTNRVVYGDDATCIEKE